MAAGLNSTGVPGVVERLKKVVFMTPGFVGSVSRRLPLLSLG